MFSFLDTKLSLIAGFVVGALLFGWIGKVATNRIEREFNDFKQSQTIAYLRAKDEAQTQQELSSRLYQEKEASLASEIKKNAVLQRVVATGRLRLTTECSGSGGIQTPTRIDEASPNPVSATRAFTEESVNQVVNDCATTTLQLNALQDSIENQIKHMER